MTDPSPESAQPTAEQARPVISHDTRQPSQSALPPDGRRTTVTAHSRIVKDHLKVAVGGNTTAGGGAQVGPETFTIYSDEPEFIGGEGQHPQPLLYIAAGIGF